MAPPKSWQIGGAGIVRNGSKRIFCAFRPNQTRGYEAPEGLVKEKIGVGAGKSGLKTN
jgi:hypothetical protein